MQYIWKLHQNKATCGGLKKLIMRLEGELA